MSTLQDRARAYLFNLIGPKAELVSEYLIDNRVAELEAFAKSERELIREKLKAIGQDWHNNADYRKSDAVDYILDHLEKGEA